MKKFLLFALLAGIGSVLTAQECSDLFFSEYLEGSGNNKGVEIYNPTDQIIDLSKYWVVRYSNGSSNPDAGGVTQLEGFLPPYSTFVLVNGQTTSTETSPACDPAMQALANMLDHDYPAPTYMNGNDAIGLLKSEDKNLATASPVDLIGEIGLGALIEDEKGWSDIQDTTVTYTYESIQYQGKVINYIVQSEDVSKQVFGPFWFSWTSDHTLVRKSSVKEGVKANPTPFIVNLEWDTVPGGANEWDSLNAHTCDCTPSTFVNSVKTLEKAQISPNPVSSGTLTLYTTHEISAYEILSVTGQLMSRREVSSSGTAFPIPVYDMNPGVYFLRTSFRQSGKILVLKFLIQ
jgi:hypothetical protein